jgi:hypothetical protein
MNNLQLYLVATATLLLGACNPADRPERCPVHGEQLLLRSGFFAQDGSMKPSRDLRPLLKDSDTLFPHMTPWDFDTVQSESNPRPGTTKVCPACDEAVATSLGRSYPEL